MNIRAKIHEWTKRKPERRLRFQVVVPAKTANTRYEEYQFALDYQNLTNKTHIIQIVEEDV